jgi:hypothetical protein
MNKTVTIATVLIAFALGALSTYLLMTKQQMDQLLGAQQQASAPVDNRDPNSEIPAAIEDTAASNTDDLMSLTELTPAESVSINDYSETQALALIEGMPDYVLGQYVDKFMAKDASSAITDKRRFAKRAIEELYKPNDNQRLVGDIKLSANPSMPTVSLDTTRLPKETKLYAHLDTHGQVPSSPFVFVKWVNNETGQVYLFEKKDIVADSEQNWVSFKPYEGWQPGSYDIRFYQFNSALQPVAQLTYNIAEVTDIDDVADIDNVTEANEVHQ